MRFVNYKDRKPVAAALKPIYTASSEQAALEALEQFKDSPRCYSRCRYSRCRYSRCRYSRCRRYPNRRRRPLRRTRPLRAQR
jgi:transposase-like protein